MCIQGCQKPLLKHLSLFCLILQIYALRCRKVITPFSWRLPGQCVPCFCDSSGQQGYVSSNTWQMATWHAWDVHQCNECNCPTITLRHLILWHICNSLCVQHYHCVIIHPAHNSLCEQLHPAYNSLCEQLLTFTCWLSNAINLSVNFIIVCEIIKFHLLLHEEEWCPLHDRKACRFGMQTFTQSNKCASCDVDGEPEAPSQIWLNVWMTFPSPYSPQKVRRTKIVRALLLIFKPP